MHLVSFKYDAGRGFGFIEGDVALDLSACAELKGCSGWAAALGEHSAEQLQAMARRQGAHRAIDELTLLPPVTDGDKIVCLGLNFRDHAREAGLPIPPKPILFTRVASSFVGHGECVLAPAASEQFDYEGELAIVIGRRGRCITRSRAMDHVLGYTVVAENSVRDWQTHSRQVTPGKNFYRSGAMGPACV